MPAQSGSGERADSLGVRRQVELPETDMDAADLASPGSESTPDPQNAEGGAGKDEKAEETAEKKGSATRTGAAAQDIAVPPALKNGQVAGDEMPPDRPKKPVLAAVAIGGAVVLAIPILLIGTGSHHTKKHPTAAAANTVLPGDGQPAAGAFTSSTPTPTPTPTPDKKDKAKKAKKASPSPTPSKKAKGKGKVLAASASGERPSASAPRSLSLHAPHDIYPGHTVRTRYIALTMQSGGNLVLRDRSNKVIWQTGTHKRGVYAELQTDGNLVLYAGDRKAVWAAGCFGHENPRMVLQSDYNLVILDHDGHPIWATGTNR